MKISIKWKDCIKNPPQKAGKYILSFLGLKNANDKKPTYDWCEAYYEPKNDYWHIPADKYSYHILKPYRWGNITLPQLSKQLQEGVNKMGCIIRIRPDPHKWTIYDAEKSLSPQSGGDKLLKVIYGIIYDDPTGIEDLDILIREKVMNNILSGKYSITTNAYAEEKIQVFDENKNKIEPIIPTIII